LTTTSSKGLSSISSQSVDRKREASSSSQGHSVPIKKSKIAQGSSLSSKSSSLISSSFSSKVSKSKKDQDDIPSLSDFSDFSMEKLGVEIDKAEKSGDLERINV